MKLLAYHNEPELKAAVLDRVRRHRDLDEIVQGTYWEGGKGCLIGCSLHSAKHESFETHLGLPVVLAYLSEKLFEYLPKEEAIELPYQLLNAIPVGADLRWIWHDFAAWLILDPEHGVARFNDHPSVIQIGELMRDHVTDEMRLHEATDAAYAANAARYDARAAAYAYANAAYAAANAAYAAAAFQVQRDKLLELLRNAPVPGNVEAEVPCKATLANYKMNLETYSL